MNARLLTAFWVLGSLGLLACGGVVAPPSASSSDAPDAGPSAADAPPDDAARADSTASSEVAVDATAPEAGAPEAGPDTAWLRVAHLDGRVPRSDVCVAPADATTVGPWTRIVDGLGYEEVSRYVAVPVRTRVVRLVPPGASCDSFTDAGGSLATTLVAGSRTTFGVIPVGGEGGFFPGGRAWTDHTTSAAPGVQVRFVDALVAFSSVDVAIDFGGGAPPLPTFAGVWTGGVGTSSPAGPVLDGYVTLTGAGVLGKVEVTLVEGGTRLTFPADLFLTRLISLYLVGSPDGHPDAPELLVCFDDLGEEAATRCSRVGLHGPVVLGG